jgi:hypothetical protein
MKEKRENKMFKCKNFKIIFLFSGLIFFTLNVVRAVELEDNGQLVIPDKVTETIKIDGELNETVWSKPPISKGFKTYHPVFGKPLGQETDIWMAYDERNLYFAFKCYDTEPDKIKTSISKRDNILRDDWIGILLDSLGNKQTSYEFYINPNGIQEDYLYSAIKGLDRAPDFVWESAGKVKDNGFHLEVRVPLESIRFKSGEEVKMGILFVRYISRLGIVGAWPEIKAGQTDFNFMTTAVYKDLKKRLKLEVLPNFTFNRNSQRESADDWNTDEIYNIGASLKYGITSSITSEATINPDFSQVESDAFQVEVNQRYPIFYSEKRPFFMEGADLFDLGLAQEGMITPVHTRRIIDPGWAAKLSGTAGKMAFAVLASDDKAPGQAWTSGTNPNQGKNAFWGIARSKLNLGSDNSLGVLYSSRYFAGGQNNVIGADCQYRFFKSLRINVSYLSSQTKDSADDQSRNGSGINAMAQYLIPELNVWATYERYGGDFVMHSAFIQRVDISRGQFFLGPNLYLKRKKGVSVLQRIQPHFQYEKLHDLGTKMDDTHWKLGVNLFFTHQGFVRVQYQNIKEAWLGQLFDQKSIFSFGRAQLFKWLYVEGSYRYGDQIYYHPVEPFLGKGLRAILNVLLQPNIRLLMVFRYDYSALKRKSDNQKIYDVDIFNVRATYQFNKYFFIRGAVRYDDFQKKLLTDFLASFTLIPGTVVHLGYGSLYENKKWQNGQWVIGDDRLLNIKNGLFFKVSYLWRIGK